MKWNRWYVVGLLSLLYVISYIDRLAVTLLVGPITSELRLSDTQISLLIGPAFAITYSALSVPVAWMVDRGNRTTLTVVGVVIWSTATITAGFSHTFVDFIILRMGVALGEAVLSPVAMSLIADHFRLRDRAMPCTVFFTAGVVGVMLAYAVGGGLIDMADHGWFREIPYIGSFATWRQTLIVIGLPGLLVGAIMRLTTREPQRGGLDEIILEKQSAGRVGSFSTMREAVRFYSCFVLGSSIFVMINLGTVAWFPTYLIRFYGVTAAMAGYIVGAMLLSAAAFTFAIPVIAQRMAKRGRRDVLLPMALILLPLGGVVYLLALIQNNFTVAFCMMAIGYGVLAGLSVLPPIVVALTAPANYRGRLTAISIASVNVIGLGGGSFCVAALADHFFKGPRGIGEALFTMAIIVVPIAWLLIYASWKPYREGITGSLNA